MWHYIAVFFAAAAVDLVPFFGPPAWTVMVLFQLRYDLDIWWVLIAGVPGSTLGRYLYSKYIPYLSDRVLSKQKSEDIRFIGERIGDKGWQVQAFVLFYTLLPMPSTPLFTAAGIAKVKSIHILPAFFIGKFTIDAIMVFSGNYAVKNAAGMAGGAITWQHVLGTLAGLIPLLAFLFIDWRLLLQQKKFRMKFNIFRSGKQ
jgi:membrane protein YqaA with SNARE-associated domain